MTAEHLSNTFAASSHAATSRLRAKASRARGIQPAQAPSMYTGNIGSTLAGICAHALTISLATAPALGVSSVGMGGVSFLYLDKFVLHRPNRHTNLADEGCVKSRRGRDERLYLGQIGANLGDERGVLSRHGRGHGLFLMSSCHFTRQESQ